MNKKKVVIVALIIILIIVAIAVIAKTTNKASREYQIEQINKYSYFVVREGDKLGIINNQGNTIIPAKYDSVVMPNPTKAIFFCTEGEITKVLNENSEELFTQFDSVEPLRLKNVSSDLVYEKSVVKYSKGGKYGIADFAGNQITKPIYEEIDTLQFKEGELLAKKDGKYGVININGAVLVKNKYDKIEADKYYSEESNYLEAGYIVSNTTEEGYRYGYVNINGKEILEPVFNELSRITEIKSKDIYIICADNGRYGLYKNGKQIINNEYQSINYNEAINTLTVLKGKRYGVLSLEGKQLVPFNYLQIDITGKNIYARLDDETTEIFDSNGSKLELEDNTIISNVENTNYKIHIQTVENKTTYSIYEGQTKKTENEYNYIEYLFDNYFIASNAEGKLGVIDNNENIVIEFNYNSIQRIDDTKLIQATNSESKITEIYTPEMKKACEMSNANIENKERYIRIYNAEEVKYISREGRELKNTEALSQNTLFASKKEDKWGFVDSTGKVVVDYKYDYVTEFNDYGFAGIKLEDKWGSIDSSGKVLAQPTYEIESIEPDFIGQYYKVIYGNGEIYYTNNK